MSVQSTGKFQSPFVFLCCIASRAFGVRRLRKFLKGNRFTLILAVPLLILAVSAFLVVKGFLGIFQAFLPSTTYRLLPPEQFNIAKAKGYPWHAIDPAGDLAPIVTYQEPRTWAIWSLSRKQAIAHGNWEAIYMRPGDPPPPRFFFSATRKEILVSTPGLPKIQAIDAYTGQLKRSHPLPLAAEVANLSPDGQHLLAMGLDWHDVSGLYGNELFIPVILDLETGRIRREPIRVNDCYFETNDTLICIRDYDVSRFNLRTRKMIMPFLAQEQGNARHDVYPRFGYSFIIDQPDGAKIQLMSNDRGHSEKILINLDGTGCIEPYRVADSKFNHDVLTAKTRISYSCKDMSFKTVVSWTRNLVIVRKEEYARDDSEGDGLGVNYGPQLLKRACYLGDMRNGRLYAVYEWKDENDDSFEPRFINDDTIGVEGEHRIQFIPVQAILAKGPVE